MGRISTRLSTRLATRVLMIVVMVIVPSIGIIVYDQMNDRQRAREDAVENASRLAHLAASDQSRLFGGVQRLLATLIMFPGLRDANPAACRALLPNVLRDHPNYINIFVVNADGSPFCAATVPSASTGRSASQAPWFTRAIATRTAAVGDYQISLTSGRPAIMLAQPIIAPSGRIERVVTAVVGLDELNATFKAVKLPFGATLTLTGRDGTILARTPDAAAWIGRRHAQFPAGRPAGADTSHQMHESTGTDGIRRLYTVLPVEAGVATGLFVTLDIESEAISAGADRLLVHHLWLLGLLTLGAFGVALIGGRLLVLQPVEAQRREAEDRMRIALEASRVGVWEHKGNDERVFWSDTLAAMHGLPAGGFGGTLAAFLACVHPSEQTAIESAIADAVATQQPTLILEYTTIWPDGTKHRLSTTAHYSYDDGALTRGSGVVVDVTEQRSLEDQLRQAQKMDAVGQLAGGVAHDFNNMLTAILGNAQFLADEFPEGDRRRIDVDEIIKAAERAAALTHQLLAFSRKQMLAPKVLHLGDVVAQMTPMLRRLLGETIDLRTTMGDRNDIKADAGQIGQVVMNLAVNARDAMKAGGRLTIETTDIAIDAAGAKQHATMTPGAYVLLTVTDTGHGMDAVTLERIFEPFFTTKPAGEGTGLGLATVYGIVKQSGGHLEVRSEPGRGTTFRIYLARTLEQSAVGETHARPALPRGSETVLVVEDEELVREFAEKVLRRQGYKVHAFASPAQAIKFATAHPSKVDLILTDVVLPGMSGPAMIGELKRRQIEPDVICMSGYTDGALTRDGEIDDDNSFLQKPFTSDQLARAVRHTLDAAVAVS